MNYYYELEEDSTDDEGGRKFNIVFDKKFIIAAAILFFVVLIILIISFSSNSKYSRMEKEMVASAKNYVQDNSLSIVTNEIYLDVTTLNINLDNSCYQISGVLYDGREYRPYLKCDKYESKILDNDSKTISLYGDDIVVLARGIPFYDPGYLSNDDIEILGEVGTTEGVYNLFYHNKNDQSIVTRKVIIINNDVLKENYPKITLNGKEVVYVINGAEYIDEGAIAIDLVDGDITNKIAVNGNINTNVPGKQIISYSITNSQGYKNTIARVVNVLNSDTPMYADYIIEPSTKVNDNVIITLSIYGERYNYTLLPTGEKVDGNIINYKVTENGKYKFLIYDKLGQVSEKVIEINNIDKEPPTAVCEAVIYSAYTKIDVISTSNKPISMYEYQINNTTVKKNAFSSYKVNNTGVTSASVTIEDSVGNKNKVSCEVMSYNTWKTDYSRVFVYLKNDSDNSVIKKYSLEDYLKGEIYLSLIDNNLSSYSNAQLLELFKALFVLKKAELFNTGKYSVYSKQLIFNINETKYCDVHMGCKLVSSGGKSFYIPKDADYKYDRDYNSSYNKISDKVLEIMSRAYAETKKEVVINKSFDDVLIKYNSSYTQITDSIKNTILSDALANKNYREIVSNRFPNYKIYNIDNYSAKINEALKKTSSYYWPIGSTYADYRGLFSGTPESTEILYDYGASNTDNKVHNGIAIRGDCNKTKAIASKDGRVTDVGYNKEYGDYVTIAHDNGVSMLYGSLTKSSITVSVGSVVKKGQSIGYVGKTDNTCMLYIETSLNGVRVNPNEYISIDNLRPASGESIVYVEGGSVKRSVCLSLLASGFSIDATAGIMANIQRESNFNLNSVGDNGTSIGLCQWHKGRADKLSNFCGSRKYTTECQLSYMLHELMNNYKSTYSYLLGNNSAYDMAYQFCFYYEVPAARETTSCTKRGDVAKSVYVPYILNNCN